MTTNLANKDADLEALDRRELEAYQRYMVSGKPPLSPATAAEFFTLYLQGRSTHELARLNPAIGLGIIVRAKVEGRWDDLRREHLQELMRGTADLAMKTELENIQFVSEFLAAFRRLAGDRLAAFLRSGDPEHLGVMEKEMTIKQFREMTELLLKIIGDRQPQQLKVAVEHRHTLEDKPAGLTGKAALEFLRRNKEPS